LIDESGKPADEISAVVPGGLHLPTAKMGKWFVSGMVLSLWLDFREHQLPREPVGQFTTRGKALISGYDCF
jgi:hypothetical protein